MERTEGVVVEERYIYHWDDYDYIETIYDTKEEKEYTDMQHITCVLNEQDQENQVLEKALELMAKSEWSDGRSRMKFLDTGIQVNSQVEYLEYFKTKAKEMMKSE